MENTISSWHCTGLPQPWDNEQDWVTPMAQELEVWKPPFVVGSGRRTVQVLREVRRKAVCRRKKWVVHFLESSGNSPAKNDLFK